MKIFGITFRRKPGKREDSASFRLGNGQDATAALVERQLFDPDTEVRYVRVLVTARCILVVGEISNYQSGPMCDYKLPPFFTQVLWADGRRGTSAYPTWDKACSSILSRMRTDEHYLMLQRNHVPDYHQLTVELISEHFPADLPVMAES